MWVWRLLCQSPVKGPLKILAVDDEPSVAQSLSFALSGPGRKFSTANSGLAALERLEKDVPPPYDVVITDNNMPGMSGIELVRRLRQEKFQGKIVVLSAFLDDENRRAYFELGVDDLLSKPFDLIKLRATIDRLASTDEASSSLPMHNSSRVIGTDAVVACP